jgi:hypothetical protein
MGEFINDKILRSLAGVTEAGRPVFLKIVYHGPRAMEELAQYDPNLVVGILGGSAGTTYDAFKLIHDAQKYGARVALFGRKINNAEHPTGLHRNAAPDHRWPDFPRGSRPRLSRRFAGEKHPAQIAAGKRPGIDRPLDELHELRRRRRRPRHGFHLMINSSADGPCQGNERTSACSSTRSTDRHFKLRSVD